MQFFPPLRLNLKKQNVFPGLKRSNKLEKREWHMGVSVGIHTQESKRGRTGCLGFRTVGWESCLTAAYMEMKPRVLVRAGEQSES